MKVLLCVGLLLANTLTFTWAASPADTVKQFVHAYNQHDLSKMLTMVSDDMKWLYQVDLKLVEETGNKEALKLAMQNHFEQRPQARSAIKDMITLGTRVVVVEEAFSNNGNHSQCALSVYEVEQSLITSVVYYQGSPCQ